MSTTRKEKSRRSRRTNKLGGMPVKQRRTRRINNTRGVQSKNKKAARSPRVSREVRKNPREIGMRRFSTINSSHKSKTRGSKWAKGSRASRNMNISELQQMAKDLGIPFGLLSKDDLIIKLNRYIQ